jgi:hypothetical protein
MLKTNKNNKLNHWANNKLKVKIKDKLITVNIKIFLNKLDKLKKD